MARYNPEIREKIDDARLRHWEIADAIGITSSTMSVWLRTPLTPERRARIEAAIDKLTKK